MGVMGILQKPVPRQSRSDCRAPMPVGVTIACFIPITYRVESPQGAIPSLVRLESPKDRGDFRRDILAPSLEICFEIIGPSGKGEEGVCDFPLALDAAGRGVASVVESGAEF